MQPGSRVGRFELVEVIGRGGMGEVWRAHNPQLERDVALKTLPARFAADAARIARLSREARLLATLNHANIASILGLEEQDGAYWLVLELVEGPTLEDRLATGRLELQQAIDIALQVADALQAAHARGIVHCDLKPANIKLSAGAQVKVLDFGIARNLQAPAQTQLTTVTAPPDAVGDIVGTPVYMSPEQSRGEPVGPTSDIWAFGVLLYRMLAGRLPFVGPTKPDTLAHVLQSAPDLELLRPRAPDALVRLLRRCLEKDPRRRIQHAGDLRILIEEALLPAEPLAAKPVFARRMLLAALGVAALAGLGLVLWLTALRSDDAGRRDPVHAELSFERGITLDRPYGFRRVAISRDGSRIAVATNSALWVRSLSAARPVAVNIDCVNPFFSPDGAWVGCFNERAGLVKIPAGGGTPIPVAQIFDRTAGATWASDGSILVATSAGLLKVNDGGGEPEVIARPDPARGERQYAWPELLPAERSLLLTVLSRDREAPPRLVRFDLDSRMSHEVLKGGSSPQYVAGGILLYTSASRLFAARFDGRSGTLRGESVPVPGPQMEVFEDNGAASYAVSNTGTLVTLRPQQAEAGARMLYWRDARGVETPLDIPSGIFDYPRVSPDGRQVAINIRSRDNRDIWIIDIERSSLARMTTDLAEDTLPVWSSDGRRVFFSSDRGGDFDIYSQAADGSDAARKEFVAPGPQMVVGTSPDNKHLLAVEEFRRLSVLDLASGSLQPLLREGAVYWTGAVSPDGKWLAYESNESGEHVEIFIRPFPEVKARREKVSIAGGRFPVWGPPGSHALYYVQPDGAMMRADLGVEPELSVRGVTRLFDWYVPPLRVSGMPYDVSRRDGRFLLSRPVSAQQANRFEADLVLNWVDELRQLVP